MRRTAVEVIERDLTNHPPDADTAIEMEVMRGKFHELVGHAIAQLPEGREKSLMLTNIEQALMWAMAALARDAYDRGASQ
jgi:hypothetical protein